MTAEALIKQQSERQTQGAEPPAERIACVNPATGEILGEVMATPPEQVAQCVERARVAQRRWAQSSFRQRRAVLGHILDYVLAHADELCDEIVRDSGKTYENAMLGEILPICNKLKWTMKYGEKYLQPEAVRSGMLMHKKGRIEYHPLGVVACIIPWNYPLQNILSSLVAPLMAGNGVVLKASEMVAWSSARFQRITDQALEKEGFSKDLVQIINGYGATGAALVRGGVQKVLFIGSVNNGRRIIEGSAEHLTPVVMELGGKDPFIVCPDADMERAVHSALGGTFINLGQNCIASERILVFDTVYDRFVAQLSQQAAGLRQGVPDRNGSVDVGAITSPHQIALIDRLVSAALQQGARALVGGQIKPMGNGQFYPPTILVDVTPDMEIAYSEVFGPVMLIFKVRDEAEAVALANATEFGLHSTVMSNDRAQAERIATQLEAGATCINDFGLCYLNQDLPFGGVKYSGFGRMNGRDGLRAYTNQKAVLTDRFGFGVPPKLFPVKPGDYDKGRETVRLLFSRSVRQRLRSLCSLVWLALKK
ncbi:aldehyde dehydrogenase family protein [Ketobacter sp.]|uniref:aldehyde dehydrogenase family protein n=1 Tax=Ketobacter sp. TaxID=2083498 RepID=UPI000F24192D|nr:aldehyde dehydrogenase family protein [Ketobacter sp.]RLT93061.1 MAG: aldehyde dehydrogenase family protein [Ketobacter sp.]